MIRLFLALAPLTLVACAADADTTSHDTTAARHVMDGTPEGIGLLAFLNEPSVDVDVLDDDVPLDVRAARNLIHHRDGYDGIAGSSDDNLFDSVQEVDDIKYVGTSALNNLYAYTADHGFVPEGGDVLGTWDGVEFTADQAVAVLALVNTASHGLLDDDIGLDRRAADSIVAGRDIDTILALSELYFIGRSALEKLVDYAGVEPEGLPAGEDCLDRSECQDGLTCYGFVNDDSTEFGKCVDMSVDGEGDNCDTDADCLEGTTCLGDIAYGGGIFCVADWQEGTYTVAESVEIPDSGEVVSDVVVYGLATVPVDVVLTLDVVHSDPESLEFQVLNMNGYSTRWATLTAAQAEGEAVVVKAFPSDDYVNGTYTLVVRDIENGTSGTLNGWSLTITSNFD